MGAVSSLPVWLQLVMSVERRRTQSESEQDLSMLGRCQVVSLKKGVDYDVDGKFSYSQVVKCGLLTDFKTTIDEHGKFSYYSSDMRPVPPGWYDLDKSKHRVPLGWYQMRD